MLDVGFQDDKYKALIPEQNFIDIRVTDENQNRYFLGDELEGLPWGNVRVGAQLTPPRQFIQKDVDQWLPLESQTFHPMESLAYGGLGCGWGIGIYSFSKAELQLMGLNHSEMLEAYNVVARRIGVSTDTEQNQNYTTHGIDYNFHKPINLDNGMGKMYEAYKKKRVELNKNNVFMVKPAHALITESLEDRGPYQHKDMDFWSDFSQSAYRPWITINQLRTQQNFTYINNCLVLSFDEILNGVKVNTIKVDSNEKAAFICQKLILACGVLGTARIVMRSIPGKQKRLPLLCNPYYYVPCLHPRMLGIPLDKDRTSFCQLLLCHDAIMDNSDVSTISLFTYRSLLLFKLIKECPLSFADGIYIMNRLQSAFVIAGIHHPDNYSQDKFIELQDDPKSPTGDKLKAVYILSDMEKEKIRTREKIIFSSLRKLGAYPIKKISPGHGSSIHYAGTLPFSKQEEPFTLSFDGRLHQTEKVFVADGSGFKFLPAKGISFTLMANAHNVARKIIG